MKTKKSKTRENKTHSPVKKNRALKWQPVVQYNLEGKFVREYSSIKEAAEILEINIRLIWNCIRRKTKSANRCQWRLKKDAITDGKITDIKPIKCRRNISNQYFQAICQFGLDGKFIREFPSILDAAGITRAFKGNILLCANKKKQYNGYQWRFKKEVVKDGKIVDIKPIKPNSPDYLRGVRQFNKNWEFLRDYPSILEAADKNFANKHSILRCANKKMKSTAGYRWRFLEEVVKDGGIIDFEPVKPVKKPSLNYLQAVCQFGLNGKFIRDYTSILEAADKNFANKHSILHCANKKMKSTAGYQWRLLEEVVKDGKIMDIEPVKLVKRTTVNYLQAVCQFGLDGKFIREFPSILDAAGITRAFKGNIFRCANKKGRLGGYQWRFKKEVLKDGNIMDIEPVKTIPPDYFRGVCQFDKDGKFIREYPSILDAANKTYADKYYILRCANKKKKSTAGYQWRFKEDCQL